MTHLKIGPGVRVELVPGATITVNTWITAKGTSSAPIMFTSDSKTTTWGGMLIRNLPANSNHVYEHCTFERASAGAVRLVSSSVPAFRDCTFQDSSYATSYGGGMSIRTPIGVVLLENCRFLRNSARSYGGGIYAALGSAGPLELKSCTFDSNVVNYPPGGSNPYSYHTYGGGAYVTGKSRLTDCVFSSNVVNSRGYSGIWCSSTPSPSARGAGACLLGATTMENCRIVRNVLKCSARRCGNGRVYPYTYGAGLYLSVGNGSSTLTNCIVARNVANAYADSGAGVLSRKNFCGGVYINGGAHSFVNCTIARNRSNRPTSLSFGVYAQLASTSFHNSIVYWNRGSQISSTNPVVNYSCIEGGYAGTKNIMSAPGFLSATSEVVTRYSFCVDAGDPNTSFDDGSRISVTPFGPGAGTTRNDMGAHGGPLNDQWIRPANLALTVTPDRSKVNVAVTFTFKCTDGNPRFPMIFFHTDSSGKVWPVISQSFGSDRDWTIVAQNVIPSTIGTFRFQLATLTPLARVAFSNESRITIYP